MKKPKFRNTKLRRQHLDALCLLLSNTCQGCFWIFQDTNDLEVDHITPKNDGGNDAWENLTLLCKPCNRKKGSRFTLSGLQEKLKNDSAAMPQSGDGSTVTYTVHGDTVTAKLEPTAELRGMLDAVAAAASRSAKHAGYLDSKSDAIRAIEQLEPPRDQPPQRTGVLDCRSHTDNKLVLDDGTLLIAGKGTKAAWRMADQDWHVEKSATATTTAVLAELLRCDARREDPDALALAFGLNRGQSPSLRRFRRIPDYPDLYYNKAFTTPRKVKLLGTVVSNLQFEPPPDHPLSKVPRIEWWLPQNSGR